MVLVLEVEREAVPADPRPVSFRSPLVLALAVVLVPSALLAFRYAARRRTEALRMFLGARASAQPDLEGVVRQRRLRAVLLASALACACVALAGPRYGTAIREGRQESLDLLIALDVSDSMRADDVAPSRLERAKLEIERVVAGRRGDRVGLVVFAGEAFLQCPLTTDRGALRLFLDAADPEQIAVQGTEFVSALGVAEQAFDAAGDDERPRALLIVSDGEDHEGGLSDAANDLRDRGVEVLALGVGTEDGAPVPDVRRGQRRGDRRDRTGAVVVSRFQPGALEDLAGDLLFRADRRPAAPALNDALDRLDRAVVSQDEFAASAERFQWPLGLALLLLAAERLVALWTVRSKGKRRRASGNGKGPGDAGALEVEDAASAEAGTPPSRPEAVAAVLLMLLGGCGLEAVQPGVREGRQGVAALEAGDLERAEQAFVAGLAAQDVGAETGARLWHGLGLARASQDRPAEADSAFARALERATTPAQRARYAYDAGTAALRAGDAARADTLLQLALLLSPTDAARRNQEIARRALDDPPPQASDLAQEIKARADSLVAERQYRQALDVMQDGLARDSSVAAFSDFIDRLGGVVQIEETQTP